MANESGVSPLEFEIENEPKQASIFRLVSLYPSRLPGAHNVYKVVPPPQ